MVRRWMMGKVMIDTPVLGEGALSAEALAAANVHPESGLATDYLNHFNEVVMLLEMLGDMPDMAEEILDWAPCAYTEHFQRTGYAGTETVVEAWAAVPHALKAHFETIIAAVDDALRDAQAKLRDGDVDGAVAMTATNIEPLLAAARAAINGRIEGDDVDDQSADQAEVDALFG
jgi:hypothetical protein